MRFLFPDNITELAVDIKLKDGTIISAFFRPDEIIIAIKADVPELNTTAYFVLFKIFIWFSKSLIELPTAQLVLDLIILLTAAMSLWEVDILNKGIFFFTNKI